MLQLVLTAPRSGGGKTTAAVRCWRHWRPGGSDLCFQGRAGLH